MTAAIDRAAILRDVWSGFGQVATGPVAGASPAAPLPSYDPRAAAAQLDAIGLRPDDSGIRLRLRHLAQPGEPWPQLAAALRTALSQIGIELTVETADAFEWHRRLQAGDYQTTGMAAEPGGSPATDAARNQAIDDATQIWLVEPYTAVAADPRLHMPGGIYSTFADAGFSP